MLQGISLKKRGRDREKERERKNWYGGTRLSWNWPISLFFREAFILWVIPRDKCKKQSCRVSSSDSYWDQAFSLHTYLYTQVLGDLHHLLARRPISILWPFSDKGLSTRKLICLKSVVLSKVWCHSQKTLNKVTFLYSKDTTIYNEERGVQWFITKRKFTNSKV